MNWITENWAMLLGIISIVCVCVASVVCFCRQPSSVQKAKVKEWLLWAVTKAETELGGGTGALKLAMVYDLFVSRFPAISKVMSFAVYAKLVDDALDAMQDLLKTKPAIKNIVDNRETI
ncbi:MAG TPA: hypothetical protein VFD23_04750 [Clostridia bacterium]|nr:hypothetical protein [Clostridia bacterium]